METRQMKIIPYDKIEKKSNGEKHYAGMNFGSCGSYSVILNNYTHHHYIDNPLAKGCVEHEGMDDYTKSKEERNAFIINLGSTPFSSR